MFSSEEAQYGILGPISSDEVFDRRIQKNCAMIKNYQPCTDEEIKEHYSSDMNPQFPKQCPVYHDDDGCELCDNMYIKPCSHNCKCIAFACYIEAVTKQRTAAISKAMMRPIKTSLNDRIVALVHEAVSKNQ